MVEFPATLESKLDLVTRFIRDIRRVARKLGEGGAPFPELQELYDLADVFQTVRSAYGLVHEGQPVGLRTAAPRDQLDWGTGEVVGVCLRNFCLTSFFLFCS